MKELVPNLYWIPGSSDWVPQFSSHSYLFLGERSNLIVDPGSSTHEAALRAALEACGTPSIDTVVVTHEHWDHIVAADFFVDAEKAASEYALESLNEQRPEVVRHVPQGETYTSKFTRGLRDGEVLDLGGFKLEVLLTPGHTRGSLCLYEPTLKFLFTGDTFFAEGSISRIFKEAGGSRQEHVRTLERLSRHGQERGIEALFSGHGSLVHGRKNCLDNLEMSLDRAREARD